MRCLALACLLAAVGCDRVPIDPVRTGLLVTSPDLGVVQFEPDLRLTLVPDGPTRPLTLRIRNKEVDFDSTAGTFVYERQLDRGLNVYPVSITDEEGGVRTDTLYAVYLPAERQPLTGVNDGVARAGATATYWGSGRTLVAGGVGASGAALATLSVVRQVGVQVASAESPLQVARAGHTATPLNGGTLLLGGASRLVPASRADFVAQAEWVDETGATQVTVVGDEDVVLRAGHVAQAVERDGETYIYMIGGRVPTGSGVAVSETVDIYRVLTAPLRLERLTPVGGATGFTALTGPRLVPTGPLSATVFGLSGTQETSVRLRWSVPGAGTFPFSLDRSPAAALWTPRAGAASVDLGGGLTLLVGGRDGGDDPVGTFELYATEVDQTFRFPETFQLAIPRSDAIATILSDTRIVVYGGRAASGSALVAYEAFQF